MTTIYRALLGLALAMSSLGVGCASAPSSAAQKVFKEGLLQAENGRVDDAMATLRKGVQSYPSFTRMRFELARLQYESGEAHHLRERQEMRKAARFLEKGQRRDALTHRRLGNEHRAKALPYYRAARENLEAVVDEEEVDRDSAWAFFLLMRVQVFFEEWQAAHDAIEQAILLGNPTGSLLAQWREFQAGIRELLHVYED